MNVRKALVSAMIGLATVNLKLPGDITATPWMGVW